MIEWLICIYFVLALLFTAYLWFDAERRWRAYQDFHKKIMEDRENDKAKG